MSASLPRTVIALILAGAAAADAQAPPAGQPPAAAAPEAPAATKPAGSERILLGSGAHTYEWVPGWLKLPPGTKFGPTHGEIVVDAKGRIIISNNGEDAILICDADGKLLSKWGKEFADGVHGLRLAKEGDREVLWLCHLKRHQVVKTTLEGEVLMTIGCPDRKDIYEKPEQFVPTAVDVAPNGDIYVVDGYGKGWLHVFNAKGVLVRSWNGAEGKAGPFKQPHGVGIDLRGPEPRVVVADRANHRLQIFKLDGTYVDAVYEELRRPSKAAFRGDDMVVVDLEGRVTIFDKSYKPVAQLGDNANPAFRGNFKVQPADWKDGEFTAPHGACWDAEGNLYVEDWNVVGRVNKLKRVR